jgi:hypothetical protein
MRGLPGGGSFVAAVPTACGSRVAPIGGKVGKSLQVERMDLNPLHGAERGFTREELAQSPLCTPSSADRGDWI